MREFGAVKVISIGFVVCSCTKTARSMPSRLRIVPTRTVPAGTARPSTVTRAGSAFQFFTTRAGLKIGESSEACSFNGSCGEAPTCLPE